MKELRVTATVGQPGLVSPKLGMTGSLECGQLWDEVVRRDSIEQWASVQSVVRKLSDQGGG